MFGNELRRLRDLNEGLIDKLEDERELIEVIEAAYPEIVRDARWALARMRQDLAREKGE